MSFDWTSGPLAEGLACYRSEWFWRAHEHWERVWLTCAGPEKTFVQALIQVTAAFHHFQRDELAGTVSLLRKALNRLDDYPGEFCGVAVEPLRQSIREWLGALEANTAPALPFPRIV
jgi:hypothetical protein